MNFVGQNFRDSCRHVANARFQIFNLTVFTADPLSFLQAFLFVLPACHSPKIFIAHLFTERVDLGTAYSNISLTSSALFGPRNVRFEAMWFTVCHELVTQSQNHTMIILTIITSNAFLYLQIHLCDTKLKLSLYIGVARIFRRGGVTLCQSEGTRFFGHFHHLV